MARSTLLLFFESNLTLIATLKAHPPSPHTSNTTEADQMQCNLCKVNSRGAAGTMSDPGTSVGAMDEPPH